MRTCGNRWQAAGFSGLRERLHVGAAALMTAGLVVVSGCSGNASGTPQVGAITFTNPAGTSMTPLKQLSAGESTYVEVPISHDPGQLGADWSSSCASAPPPGTPLPPGETQDPTCGTFSPGHTLGGPIPSYLLTPNGYITLFTAPAEVPKGGVVTLTATATADRSQTTTTTLVIAAQAVLVQLAPAPPESLNTSATAQVTAVVNNDPQNAGVSWSVICGAVNSDCGSFNPAQTKTGVATVYTAPANTVSGSPASGGPANSVQITATSVTDPNKVVSAFVTITTPQTAATAVSVLDR